jgi:hypothetical protein
VSGAYPGYPAYHPPVAVPYYSASGCYGCAAAAGAVVGATVGAVAVTAAASSAYAASAAATSNAYAAGVAAGAAAAAPVAYSVGVNYAALPGGCMAPQQTGNGLYLCGNNWFKPVYGANGLYYVAVSGP